MKTALQELISDLENFKTLPIMTQGQIHSIDACIGFAEIRLKSEKSQIIHAHLSGQKFASDNHNPDSEEYYTETFTTH